MKTDAFEQLVTSIRQAGKIRRERMKLLRDLTPEERIAAEAELAKLFREDGRAVFERIMRSEADIEAGRYVTLEEAIQEMEKFEKDA